MLTLSASGSCSYRVFRLWPVALLAGLTSPIIPHRQDKVKKVLEIWKKSSTFSSEALKPCYARLEGETVVADPKTHKSNSHRQYPLLIISGHMAKAIAVWSARPQRLYRTNVESVVPLSVRRNAPRRQVPWLSRALFTQGGFEAASELQVIAWPAHSGWAVPAAIRSHADGWCIPAQKRRTRQQAKGHILVVSQYHTQHPVYVQQRLSTGLLRRYPPPFFSINSNLFRNHLQLASLQSSAPAKSCSRTSYSA